MMGRTEDDSLPVVFESCSDTLMKSGDIVRCQMHQLERSLFNIYAAIPPDT